jgi:hypothetical protein
VSSFTGVDYLDFDSVLGDEEKPTRNTTRQFVDDQIMPIIESASRFDSPRITLAFLILV